MEVADMSRPYSFQIPEAIEKSLPERVKAVKHYTDPDTYDHVPSDDPPDWPCILNAFVEWHLRNGALPKLLRDNYYKLAHCDEHSNTLNTLITATENAFADFYVLWEWAREVWEHDPVIRTHFVCKGGNGEMEEADPRMIEVEEAAVCTHFPGPGEFAVNVM